MPYEAQQRCLCRDHAAPFLPPRPGSKVGIAFQTIGRFPIHGVGVRPTGTANGWFIHAGDESSDAEDSHQPLRVEQLERHCPAVLPFLALPAGWRVMSDGRGGVDVWHEAPSGRFD